MEIAQVAADASIPVMPRRQALDLLDAASDYPRLAGWYHDNALVTKVDHSFIIRTERWTADFDPEPRQFSEDSVLRALAAHEIPGPRLRHTSSRPRFMVLDYLPGTPVSECSYPVDELHRAVAGLFRALGNVDRGALNLLPAGRRFAARSYRSSAGFHRHLVAWLDHVYGVSGHRTHAILGLFGIAESPFSGLRQRPVARRQLRLCHGDFNPSNCLWDGTSFRAIDWELALWGDPAWDIACYLHRFSFDRSVEAEALDFLLETQHVRTANAAFVQDVITYRRIEMLRSVVIDAARLVASDQSITSSQVQSYVSKTANLLGLDIEISSTSEQVLSFLRVS